MEVQDVTAPEAPVAPPPADSPAAAEPGIAKPESRAERVQREESELDDDLRQAYRKATTPRSEDGKFAPKTPREEAPAKAIDEPAKPAEAAKTAAEPEKPATEAAKPAKVAPPQSWKAEVKAKWDSLPPEVQSYVAEREAEAHKQISTLGERAKTADRLQELFAPHMERVPRDVSPAQYVDYLLAADAALSQDPVDFIRRVAQANNVDLNQFVTDPNALSDPQSAQWEAKFKASQAKIEALERRLGEVGQTVIGREQAERAAREQQYQKTVDEFAADKSDWQDVMPYMGALIEQHAKDNPTASPQEILKSAYEAAQWANPKTRQALQEAAAKEAEAKRLEEAKQAATRAKRAGSINVKGSPSPISQASLDDDLRAVWRRAQAS